MQNSTRKEKTAETVQTARSPSVTAEWMALTRAGESRKPEDERICYDPYAFRFLSRETLETLANAPEKMRELNARHERLLPGRVNSIVARIRFIDDTVRMAVGDGIDQLVIPGAGYDTRACRIAGLKKCRVFEADHPATQQIKVQKVKGIFGSLPAHVTYVPVDFETEDFGRKLLAGGYDPAKKTLFVLEGLVYYITPEAVDGLLAFIAHNSGKGSAVVFDYIPKSVADGTSGLEAGKNWHQLVQEAGEPFRFGIENADLDAFLSQRGFTKIRKVTVEDYRRLYFYGKNEGRVLNSLMSFAYAEVNVTPAAAAGADGT